MRNLFLLACIVALQPSPAAIKEPRHTDAGIVKKLLMRVAPPSDQALAEFKKAGMEHATAHVLTATEQSKVKAALASLPSLNKRVLEEKLHSLAFVDGIVGTGTGLTSTNPETGLYDITLRAGIINEALSKFLTAKESRIFTEDDPSKAVKIAGTGVNALTYVLLHESTHVVDASCRITTSSHSVFSSGIWDSDRELTPSLSQIVPKTLFRGGSVLPLREASKVYSALARTPFITLYATASEHEDFAELLTWRVIQKQHGGSLVIRVKSTAEHEHTRRWEPLSFPGVRERFAEVDKLLASKEACHDTSRE